MTVELQVALAHDRLVHMLLVRRGLNRHTPSFWLFHHTALYMNISFSSSLHAAPCWLSVRSISLKFFYYAPGKGGGGGLDPVELQPLLVVWLTVDP